MEFRINNLTLLNLEIFQFKINMRNFLTKTSSKILISNLNKRFKD